jgi:hypothetical protein
MGRRLLALAATAVAGYSVFQWLGRTDGSTREERRRTLPGDELVIAPVAVTDHATTIDAPPDHVWPWLVQMGWHRGGWYTARWVDRLLFPDNEPSAERLIPELQHLRVGDEVPDGAPETRCVFVVTELEPNRHLVLHSTEHLPPELAARFGAWIDWSWAFVVVDLGDGRTRFHLRSRFRLGPRWVAAGYLLTLVPADAVMARQMMRGLRARAERTTDADVDLATR